jgi:hypothetical protein
MCSGATPKPLAKTLPPPATAVAIFVGCHPDARLWRVPPRAPKETAKSPHTRFLSCLSLSSSRLRDTRVPPPAGFRLTASFGTPFYPLLGPRSCHDQNFAGRYPAADGCHTADASSVASPLKLGIPFAAVGVASSHSYHPDARPVGFIRAKAVKPRITSVLPFRESQASQP